MKKRGHFNKLNKTTATLFGFLPKSLLKFIYNRSKNITGYVGLGIRYACIKNLAKSCGENVAIFPDCVIKNIHLLSIGNNVSIHNFCFIDAYGGVSIGNDVSIANHTSIISFGHTWRDDTIPIKYNMLIKTPIEISNDVWIGCGVRIIGSCRISSRCIVAAGAVVKGLLSENSIYGGVPAKLIKRINNFNPDSDNVVREQIGKHYYKGNENMILHNKSKSLTGILMNQESLRFMMEGGGNILDINNISSVLNKWKKVHNCNRA